jgi:hypothetical protein
MPAMRSSKTAASTTREAEESVSSAKRRPPMLSRRLRCRTRASLTPARRASSTTCSIWLASSTGTSTRLNTGCVIVSMSLADALSLTGTLSPKLIMRHS